jgi:outer membrane protein assembly factor BamA
VICATVTFLLGCASRRTARKVSGAEYRLRDIEIEGNRKLKDKDIERYLNLRETTWFPLPDRHYLYEGYVPVDADRIEELYAAHGYYDAAVIETRVEKHPKRPVADVVFVVDEGEPAVIESIEFLWPQGRPKGPPDRKAEPSKIKTHCGLKHGGAFDVEEMHASEATMREALRNRGYAFADVAGRAYVDRRAKTARVAFAVVPGPFVRIGEVKIEGLTMVDERPIRVEIEEYIGKPFSPHRVRNMEDAVYALNIFSAVTIEEAKAPRGQFVDLVMRVDEGHPQSVKLGVGIGIESNRWEQYGAVRYTHENLFKNLTRFDVKLRAGYAELPALYRPEEHGPIIELEPTLRKKGLLEKKLVWTLAPKFELGIWEGYQFYSPSNRVGVSRFFTRFVETGISHNLRFVDFFSVSPTLQTSRSILALDFRDPYILSYIQLQLRFHLTDRLFDPRNGAVVSATYDLAGGIFGGQFDYQKVMPELRAYWTPLRNRLQFALRGQVGFIFPFGDEPGAPFDLRLYLGGTNSVRGWGVRRLSPFIRRCNTDGSCEQIPVGGNTSILGNFETRVRVWKGLWTVAFLDMGDVQPEVGTFKANLWNYSAGPGLRYDSRIGTFRIDFGVRLNNPTMYQNQPRWALHFGLGEAF